jgi:uncharacterized membrane protein YjjP (DUF1212 family)
MRVEIVLLFMMLATMFSLFALIPVVFIYGIWNVTFASLFGLPDMNIWVAFLVYLSGIGLYSIIRNKIGK